MARASALLLAAATAALLALAGAAPCPPPGFSTVENFSLASYSSRPWFSIQQAPNSYQSRNSLFCVRAEYRKDPADASRLLVFNQAKQGSVTGQQQAGGRFLLRAVVRDESRGKLAVGPPFLPASTYGPYWVVAAGPGKSTDAGFSGYEWAVVSGGPPTEQGSGGTCTNTRAGTPGIGGGEGLWLFSREPTPSQAVVEQLRQVAAAKGFDLSVLVPVQQQGCSYAPFPESSGAGTPSGPFGGFSG